MPTQSYRFYRLDCAGHLHEAAWFVADSDEDAIEQIRTKHPNSKCEVWQGRRLVASISPERLSA